MKKIVKGKVPKVISGTLPASQTAQTPGMIRKPAIHKESTGASKIWFGTVTCAPNYKGQPHHHGEAETAAYVVSGYVRVYYGEDFKDSVESVFEKKFEYLIDLNTEIIKFVMNELEIKSKIVFSSELKISKKGSDRILDICKKVGADYYITGTSWAQSHLRIDEFKKSNIVVEFQKFQHPIYTQIHGKFVPEMSIIDLLFNEGKDRAKEILQNSIVSSS